MYVIIPRTQLLEAFKRTSKSRERFVVVSIEALRPVAIQPLSAHLPVRHPKVLESPMDNSERGV